MLEDSIEFLLDTDEEVDEEDESEEYIPRTDEEELRHAVWELDVLERAAHLSSSYVNTKPTRQRIYDLMKRIAENEHRFFKIVEEYNPERSRHELVLKEITSDKQGTL